MLVNASAHPGPAIWQGVMLVVLVWWMIYIFVGVGLFWAILAFVPRSGQ